MATSAGYKNPPKDTQFGGKRANKRNNKGKPRSFDALRKLAQQIAHDEIGNGMTVTEAILRKWAASTDPRLQIQFMEVCFGKVPAPVEISGKDGQPLAIILDI